MYREIFGSMLLILLITAFIAPITSSPITFAYPMTNNEPIIPQIPFKHELYLDTKLSTSNSTIDFSDTMEHVLSTEFNNTAYGNFTLDLNEDKLDLRGMLEGEIRYYNETLNISNTEFSITINSRIHGENKEFQGNIEIRGTINITLETQQFNISFDIPIIINGTFDEKNNISTNIMKTKNAYIVFNGERIDIKYTMKQVINLNKQLMTTTTDLKAYSKNQYILLMFAQIMSIMLGISIQPPIYDPSTGKYVISYSGTRTDKLETMYLSNEYLVNATRIDAKADIIIEGKGQGHLVVINFKASGYINAVGDFRKALSMDKKGYTKIRSMSVKGEIILEGNKVIIKINGHGEYYSINLYAVQFTYRNIVPELLNKSIALEGSKAVIEGSDGIKLMLNEKLYNKLIFTPENASLAKNLYIVVNGTVLEANTLEDKTITYRAVEKTEMIKACIMSDNNEKIIVMAQNTHKVVIETKNTLLNGKVIESIFGKHDKIEIIFPNTTTPIKGKITTYILQKLPKELPENTFNISKIYNITPVLNTQTEIEVKLYFDPEKIPENAEILVAHYVNGNWQIIKPENVNKEEGYVEVTLTSFSPIVVIAKTTPETTTTTTTTTATTTSTTVSTTTTTTVQTTTKITTTSPIRTTTTKTTTETTTRETTTTQTTTTPAQTTTQETTTPSTTTPSETQPSTGINTTIVGAIIAVVIIGLVFILVWRRK